MSYRFLISCENSLHLLQFDPDRMVLQQFWGIQVEVGAAAIGFEGSILVSTRKEVEAFDPALNPISAPVKAPFAAGVLARDRLYLATDGALACFDPTWQELGRVTLVRGRKDAHDLVRVGNRIFALDNVILPVYVAVVDITREADLKVVAVGSVQGVNPHLDAQFIDQATGLWGVLMSIVHSEGRGQVLHVLEAESATPAGEPVHLCSRSHLGFPRSKVGDHSPLDGDPHILWPGLQDASQGPPGIEIQMVSASLPTWVIGSQLMKATSKERYAVYRLSVRHGRVVLEHFAPLWENEDQRKFAMWGDDSWLFIVSKSEDRADGGEEEEIRLTVVDPTDRMIIWDAPLPVQIRNAGRLRSVLPWPNPHEGAFSPAVF